MYLIRISLNNFDWPPGTKTPRAFFWFKSRPSKTPANRMREKTSISSKLINKPQKLAKAKLQMQYKPTKKWRFCVTQHKNQLTIFQTGLSQLKGTFQQNPTRATTRPKNRMLKVHGLTVSAVISVANSRREAARLQLLVFPACRHSPSGERVDRAHLRPPST